MYHYFKPTEKQIEDIKNILKNKSAEAIIYDYSEFDNGIIKKTKTIIPPLEDNEFIIDTISSPKFEMVISNTYKRYNSIKWSEWYRSYICFLFKLKLRKRLKDINFKYDSIFIGHSQFELIHY